MPRRGRLGRDVRPSVRLGATGSWPAPAVTGERATA